MSWREVTIVLIVITIVGLSVYDLCVYLVSGNAATISRTLLDGTKEYPLIMVLFCVGFGVLLGHLFVPQHVNREQPPAVQQLMGRIKP